MAALKTASSFSRGIANCIRNASTRSVSEPLPGSSSSSGHTIEVTINALIDGFYRDTHFFLTNVQLDGTF